VPGTAAAIKPEPAAVEAAVAARQSVDEAERAADARIEAEKAADARVEAVRVAAKADADARVEAARLAERLKVRKAVLALSILCLCILALAILGLGVLRFQERGVPERPDAKTVEATAAVLHERPSLAGDLREVMDVVQLGLRVAKPVVPAVRGIIQDIEAVIRKNT
jgi:hypothetical protein